MAQLLDSIFNMGHDVRWPWSGVAYSSSKSKFDLLNSKKRCSAIFVNEEGRGDYISAVGSSWGGHNGKMWTIGLGWCGIKFWGIWYDTNPVWWEGGKRKKKYLNRIEKQILRLHLGTTFAFFCFFFFFFWYKHKVFAIQKAIKVSPFEHAQD